MHVSLRTALVLFATTAVAAGACGGNVVVDTPTGSTGIANGGAGPTTGTEPETTDTGFGTTVTGFGTTGTGFGGSNTTTGTGFGASDTGTGFGTSTTTGTGFGGSNTTTGTGFGTTSVSVSSSSGGPSGACTNPSDLVFLDGELLYPAIVTCAEQFLGAPGPTTTCIESQTGLTPPCTACVVSDLQCSIESCLGQCQSKPASADCETCRNDHCAAPFIACSGLGYGPGSTTCADALTQGTKGMGWPGWMPAEAFVTQSGFESYQLVDQCACNPGGACANLCSGSVCALDVAIPECVTCLESSCSAAMQKCSQN